MECNWRNSLALPSVVVALAACVLVVLGLTKLRNRANKQRPPPGPPGWPVFGNMFDLGTMPHQNLYTLASKYGPVLWLRLGSVNTMVVQSAKAAEELFKKHDQNFSDRRVPHALTAWNYYQGSLGVGRYGSANWRLLRRLCSSELMINKRVNETAALRRECVDKIIGWIEEAAALSRSNGGAGEVELSRYLFLLGFNVIGCLVLSMDVVEPGSEEGREFFHATKKFMELAGTPNVADFLPFLKPVDPLRIRRNMVKEMGRALKIVAGFVRERIRQKESGIEIKANNKDFLDVLLEYRGDDGKEPPDRISERNIAIIILEMFFAGSETSAATIEWAMAELLRNPDSMRKVKEELDRVIDQPNRRVEEGDIEELPYLQAVVKETFRLHPGLPFLVPRNSMEDCNYLGYHIPKNTQVFVNAWAIGRDPESWEDPLSFKPERFLAKNIDYKGQHFELIPFGSGRRICIGYPMAQRLVHLALATMLQSFDWELGNFVTPMTMDMNERMGLTLRKLVPLTAIPTTRIA